MKEPDSRKVKGSQESGPWRLNMNGSGVKEDSKTTMVLPSTPSQYMCMGYHSIHGDPESYKGREGGKEEGVGREERMEVRKERSVTDAESPCGSNPQDLRRTVRQAT